MTFGAAVEGRPKTIWSRARSNAHAKKGLLNFVVREGITKGGGESGLVLIQLRDIVRLKRNLSSNVLFEFEAKCISVDFKFIPLSSPHTWHVASRCRLGEEHTRAGGALLKHQLQPRSNIPKHTDTQRVVRLPSHFRV
jgi:hypothetical protein